MQRSGHREEMWGETHLSPCRFLVTARRSLEKPHNLPLLGPDLILLHAEDSCLLDSVGVTQHPEHLRPNLGRATYLQRELKQALCASVSQYLKWESQ